MLSKSLVPGSMSQRPYAMLCSWCRVFAMVLVTFLIYCLCVAQVIFRILSRYYSSYLIYAQMHRQKCSFSFFSTCTIEEIISVDKI